MHEFEEVKEVPQYPALQAHPCVVDGLAFRLIHVKHNEAWLQVAHPVKQATQELEDESG